MMLNSIVSWKKVGLIRVIVIIISRIRMKVNSEGFFLSSVFRLVVVLCGGRVGLVLVWVFWWVKVFVFMFGF